MTTPRLIAALGSSFAVGPGMPRTSNYAHLLAEKLGARLVDLSVSGATTATILETRQRVGLRTVAPQLDGVPADADVVTITAGGNDLEFAGSMMKAALATRLDSRPITIPLAGLFRGEVPIPTEADIDRTASGLRRIVTAVETRAPAARVLLVEYLTVIGRSTTPSESVQFSTAQIEQFAVIQAALGEAYARAGAEVIRIADLSRDHGLGSADPWVHGYEGVFGPSFHPNEAGMRAIANEIARVLSTS